MSQLEGVIYEWLRIAFPKATIKTQHRVDYQGQLLIFDFFIPSINLVVECQGEQHYKFVPHFHTMQAQFKEQRWRDSLKREWATVNEVTLLELAYNDLPDGPVALFNVVYDTIERGS